MGEHRLAVGRCRVGSRSRTGVVAVLVGAVLLLTGCSSIPTGGPVQAGRSASQDPGDLRVIPPDPALGASPEEIVRGFLLAAGETDSEYSTARKFLTADRGTQWRPDAGTVVYSRQGPQLMVTADGRAVPTGSAVGPDVDHVTVSVRMPVVATIDARGRYAAAPSGATRDAQFALVRVDGQWRINELEDGVLVAESFLRLVYGPFDLFFLDPSETLLVPETRWLPKRDANATILTRELLAGPSSWLQGAVRSALPGGTQLAPPGSVRLEDGVARVDLSAQVLQASARERVLLLAQLKATLLPVEDISSVLITVEGGEIDVSPAQATLAEVPAVDSWPVLLHEGRLVRLRPGRAIEVVPGLPDLTGRDPSHPAMSHQQSSLQPFPLRYAVLASQRSQLLVLSPGDEQAPRSVLTGADLTAPSFDPFGWLWSTSALSTGEVTAVSADGNVVSVTAPWLAGRRVTSLRISRDGTRALVASTDVGGVGHVAVAGVVRNADLVPQALSPEGPLELGVKLVRVEAAVWLDDLEVAALGRVASEDEGRVYPLTVGGPDDAPMSPVPEATGLAAGSGEASVLVTTASGAVLEQAGAAWVPVRGLEGARDPAFAG